MKQTVDHRREMKRLRMGGMYQDAAGGREAASGMRQESRPTQCHWAAANALLISAVEKIPPHPRSTSIHSCLCQPAWTRSHHWAGIIFSFWEAWVRAASNNMTKRQRWGDWRRVGGQNQASNRSCPQLVPSFVCPPSSGIKPARQPFVLQQV